MTAPSHISFWESNFLLVLATVIVGLVALYVYWKQKVDQKKDAASIVLQEIRRASKKLQNAKEIIDKDGIIPETIFALKTSNIVSF
jgi:predicted negative regulator of RcsB-dependent stress response